MKEKSICSTRMIPQQWTSTQFYPARKEFFEKRTLQITNFISKMPKLQNTIYGIKKNKEITKTVTASIVFSKDITSNNISKSNVYLLRTERSQRTVLILSPRNYCLQNLYIKECHVVESKDGSK